MELTIEEAFQKGVETHKAGQIKSGYRMLHILPLTYLFTLQPLCIFFVPSKGTRESSLK